MAFAVEEREGRKQQDSKEKEDGDFPPPSFFCILWLGKKEEGEKKEEIYGVGSVRRGVVLCSLREERLCERELRPLLRAGVGRGGKRKEREGERVENPFPEIGPQQ